MPETISAEEAAGLVKSGMWLDYGACHCQPDVFDRALAARRDKLTNVKIRSCLTMRRRAVIEEDPNKEQFHVFSWHFTGYDRKKHDANQNKNKPKKQNKNPNKNQHKHTPVDVV